MMVAETAAAVPRRRAARCR